MICGAAQAQDNDRGYIAGLLEDALGGEGRVVRIEGFSGALRSTARIERVTIADPAGVWLTIEDAELTWQRSALLRGAIEIESLRATRIVLPRLPNPVPGSAPTAAAPGFSLPELPVSVNVGDLGADRIEIGAPVLGEDVALQLRASAKLADGALDATLNARRLGGKAGQVALLLQFVQAGEALTLDLEVSEGVGGIAAQRLGLPGVPSVDLSAQGRGPLSDFSAIFDLRTDGAPRLEGAFRLSEPEEQPGARAFAADVTGDVTALFAPQYRAFFGPDVSLVAQGARDADGAIDLTEFALTAQAVNLRGRAALNADAWPLRFDVTGSLGCEDGAPVLLPLAGPETTLQSAQFDLRHDGAASDIWEGRLQFEAFARDAQRIDSGSVTLDGTIAVAEGQASAIGADLALKVRGLDTGDADVNAALGSAVDGRARIDYTTGTPLRLSDVSLNGASYALAGDVAIDGLDSAFAAEFDVGLQSTNLTGFSGISGQTLSGAADVTLRGTADVGGAFDVDLAGRGTDLRVGIEAVDTLLSGQAEVALSARRDAVGLTLREARFMTDRARANAQGTLTDAVGDLRFDADLTNASDLAPQINGPVALRGALKRQGAQWSVDAQGEGPYSSRFSAAGEIAPTLSFAYEFDLPNLAALVPEFPGPVALEGTLRDEGGALLTKTAAQGPGGASAQVTGKVTPDLSLQINGAAPLGLANPFLQPRSILGGLAFDLTQVGTDLTGLSGQVRVTDAVFVAPEAGLRLESIRGSVDLARGRAQVAMQGAPERGGLVSVRGPVVLSGGNSADLNIALTGVRLEDPQLYRTLLDGQISVRGPLTGGAQIAGRIDVDESLITLASPSVGSFGAIPEIRHQGETRAIRATRQRAGLIRSDAATSGGSAAYPLDVTISAPARIFVRGRGLDAELGGALRLSGTTAAPISSGAINLIRGRFDILAKRFSLSRGEITLLGDFDPFLNFAAESRTDTGTASVILEGRASDPTVRFESSPSLPQEEVLAQLIFGRDLSSLSAFQALQLANAVATLAGRKGVSLLGRLREGFALDDIDVTTDDAGNANLRVGKYLTDNIYTDVTVGDGDDAGVALNIDLTPNVTVRGATTQGSGTSVGVFFEKDY